MSTPPSAPDLSATAPGADRIGDRALRWGFLGAGQIAGTFARALAELPGHEVVAVGARDGARAAAFAAEHAVRRSYGSYDELIADDEVDVIYVSTTHPHHHAPALACIRAGRPVLVEKPLALNAAQATELLGAARAAGVFSMEAMWLRTQPLLLEVERVVADGAIGDLVHVSAEFAVGVDYDPQHRIFDLANGGGALLDLGVYAAAFCWLFLGEPESVQIMGSLAPSGADRVVAMQWGYDSGAVASVFTASQAVGPNRASVIGRTGWVEIEEPFWRSPGWAVLHVDGAPDRRIEAPSRGYAHQAEEVERCLRAGLLESPLVPHAGTIGVLEIIDAARSELGVRYPQE
ncbi:MAG: Gfo/Idh/MocA family oxidoreductase [Austwickia sp.]|jgi:predicted dehydrogenase|nr:MAG: Gfo/Idh/MocA family oxidoreductase [Austwickia sp.]